MNLSDEQLNEATEYLTTDSDTATASLIALDAKTALFPPMYFTEQARSLPPVVWWQGVKKYVSSDLADRAITLLSCPPSSASIERVFSNFGVIHSKMRNRLGNKKAPKLVFCYRMLRGDKEIDE